MGSRELSYDVVVIGGGPAGMAAAVAAAGAGARTLLAEKYGFLGGMATAGMVGTVCGLFHNSADGPPRFLNEGFARTFGERLSALPGCGAPLRRGRTFVVPYAPFSFACLADDVTREAGGLDVLLHAHLTGAEVESGRVAVVRLSTWEGVVPVAGRAFVDSSGDAALALLAGAAVDVPSSPQLPSLVFVLQGVDHSALAGGKSLPVLRALATAEAQGRLPRGAASVALRPTANPGEVILKLALDGVDVVTPNDVASFEREARSRARALAAFLKAEVPAFVGSFVSHSAPQVGVRESRRIVGRYRLTREDVLSGRSFEDAVARGAWPIELWTAGAAGATYEYLEDGLGYDIPLRALRTEGLDNVFVAGRCLSATHEAAASARVIGTCLAVGEGVGKAAARWAGTS